MVSKARNTAAAFFAAMAPVAVRFSELAAVVTIDIVLDPSYAGGFAAKYEGQLDEAGTIKALAYLGAASGSLTALEGERLTSTTNKWENQHQTRNKRIKFAWGDPDATTGGNFVTITVPESLPLVVPVLEDGQPVLDADGEAVTEPRRFVLNIVE